jgi:exodeoxyribonuclease VII small subunit
MTTKSKVEKTGGEAEGGVKLTFEQSIERLEKIVADMESGKFSLEEMISRFEEGQKLIRFCSAKLNEVEKKVEVLVKKGGEVVAEPFEAVEDAGGEPEAGARPRQGGEAVDF